MNLTRVTAQQLRQAADLKERIDALVEELNAILGGAETPAPAAPAEPERPTNGRRKSRKLSAEGRAAISAAAKARWAARRLRQQGAASEQADAAPAPAGKKLHWTQRPGAKARLARLARLGWRRRRA